MKLNRRSTAVLATSATALVMVWVAATAAAPGDPEDPATTPIPQYDYDNPGRSFLVELDFGTASASLIDVSVGEQLSTSHVGDPPQLQLALTDEDGAPAGSLNAWDPRLISEDMTGGGGGERTVVHNGPSTLTFPFDGDTATLLVRDLPAGIDLATVDLRPAVHEFCVGHPDDPECLEADLAVTSTTATGDSFAVLGKPVAVSVDATIANLGPDGPVDADVTQTVSSSAGVTVTPTSRTFDVDALAVGSPRSVHGDHQITCTAPGAQSVTFTTSVVPEKAKVADLVAGNNSATASYSVDCAVPVTINAMPGSLANPVYRNTSVIPVAVLTTAAGEYGNPLAFDAATIQAATVRLGVRSGLIGSNSGAPEAHGQVHLEDSFELDEVTHDGDLDGIVHGRRNLTGIQPSTTEICVRGRFGPGTGTSFFGCDHIVIVP